MFIRKSLLGLAFALLAAAPLFADIVSTKDGARLVGKITKIYGGDVFLTTTYAGDLKIKQTEVVAIETDKSVEVRLAGNVAAAGRISTQDGVVQIAGAGSPVTTPVDKIMATWPEGSTDPDILALEHHWLYSATLDVNGATGNQHQTGTDAGLDAKLVTPQYTLEYDTDYNRQVSDGTKSADQFKAGVDYAAKLSDGKSLFANDTLGFDHIMDIKFYDTVAAGVGYNFIKNSFDQLTGRVGLAYRYDAYLDPTTPTVDTAAADFEINHDLKFPNWELVNNLKVVPILTDFSNLVITQDSYYQVPLAKPSWKLRVGFSNNYNSRPGPGFQRLDTLYYTRLILAWP